MVVTVPVVVVPVAVVTLVSETVVLVAVVADVSVALSVAVVFVEVTKTHESHNTGQLRWYAVPTMECLQKSAGTEQTLGLSGLPLQIGAVEVTVAVVVAVSVVPVVTVVTVLEVSVAVVAVMLVSVWVDSVLLMLVAVAEVTVVVHVGGGRTHCVFRCNGRSQTKSNTLWQCVSIHCPGSALVLFAPCATHNPSFGSPVAKMFGFAL